MLLHCIVVFCLAVNSSTIGQRKRKKNEKYLINMCCCVYVYTMCLSECNLKCFSRNVCRFLLSCVHSRLIDDAVKIGFIYN